MAGKIGIGYITCNAPDRVVQSLPLIPSVDSLVIVNDGEQKNLPQIIPNGAEVIQHNTNKGVGISKNDALRYLMDEKCEHIFLVEDDVLINNPNTLAQYIHAAEESGIYHLNYALQGPGNRKQTKSLDGFKITDGHTLEQNSEPLPKGIKHYKKTSLAFYHNICGALSYYHDSVIKEVGYFDERYFNAMEHVDHTYKITKTGKHPPFWWFADIENSNEYIGDVKDCVANSTIRNNPEFSKNFNQSLQLFEKINGIRLLSIPDPSANSVIQTLKNIEEKYGKKYNDIQ